MALDDYRDDDFNENSYDVYYINNVGYASCAYGEGEVIFSAHTATLL